MHRITLGAIGIAAVAFFGCTKNSSELVATTQQPAPSFAVSPSDGQGGVRLDAAVELSFAKPVDGVVVQRNLHLMSELSMSDSLCPTPVMGLHGSMTDIMADSTMMRHMDQAHSIRGTFSWNADSTKCRLVPDSMMVPRTLYMVHMGGEMMDMLKQRIGDVGIMTGHGSGMMSRDMVVHFSTLDTTGGGGGHDSHHGG
jgi:hypothetical protein